MGRRDDTHDMGPLFAMPTRGGKLTLLNCLLWGVAALGVVTDVEPLGYTAVIACWPFAYWFFMPTLNSSREQLVLACVVAGVNAFAWGYGLSWILTRMKGRSGGPESERRGFEVVTGRPAGSPADPRR